MGDQDDTLPATRDNGAVSTLLRKMAEPEPFEGLEGFAPSQLGFRQQELRLVHSIRRRNDVGRPGQLKFGREPVDTAFVVLLMAHPFRSLREGEGEDDKKTVCASGDGFKPMPVIPKPRAKECGRTVGGQYTPICPYAFWDRSGAKVKPPPCAEGIAFLGLRLDKEPPEPFWLLCQKTAQMAAAGFIADVRNTPDVRAFHQLAVKITTKEERGKEGRVWYTPVFTVVDRFDYDRFAPLAKEVRGYRYQPRVEFEPGDVEVEGGDEDAEAGKVIETTGERVVLDDDAIPF